MDPPTKAPFTTIKPNVVPTVPISTGQHNITNGVIPPAPIYIRNEYVFQMTTWYTLIFIGIFILTGILHGLEVISLVYGILYWLCLPTGHLLLTIYSIANLTDRSWGK